MAKGTWDFPIPSFVFSLHVLETLQNFPKTWEGVSVFSFKQEKKVALIGTHLANIWYHRNKFEIWKLTDQHQIPSSDTYCLWYLWQVTWNSDLKSSHGIRNSNNYSQYLGFRINYSYHSGRIIISRIHEKSKCPRYF